MWGLEILKSVHPAASGAPGHKDGQHVVSTDRVAYISLGSNLGQPEANLETARENLALLPGVDIGPVSSLYYTEPQGVKDQPWFANQVLAAACAPDVTPLSLLASLLDIEARMGRQRRERWGPRLIDLDVLFFGHLVLHEPALTLPHPRIGERAFILVPLLEIAPDFVFPDGSRADIKLQGLDYRIEDTCIWQKTDDR